MSSAKVGRRRHGWSHEWRNVCSSSACGVEVLKKQLRPVRHKTGRLVSILSNYRAPRLSVWAGQALPLSRPLTSRPAGRTSTSGCTSWPSTAPTSRAPTLDATRSPTSGWRDSIAESSQQQQASWPSKNWLANNELTYETYNQDAIQDVYRLAIVELFYQL